MWPWWCCCWLTQIGIFYLVAVGWQGVLGRRDTVNIDLNTGVVTGYSRHITFQVPPAQSGLRGRCVRQAVIKLALNGNPYNKAILQLEFERPRLWTLHLSRTPASLDGHLANISFIPPVAAAVVDTTSKWLGSELHVFNRQLSVHNDVRTTSIDVNGPSTRLFDEVLNRGRSKLVITIAEGQLQWTPSKGQVEKIDWPIGTINAGPIAMNKGRIYAGLNRVIGGDWTGSGLCHVRIQLTREEGKLVV